MRRRCCWRCGSRRSLTLSAYPCSRWLLNILVGVVLSQNRTLEMIVCSPMRSHHAGNAGSGDRALVIIWVGLDNVWLALLVLAWLVAFFPMLSNTALGMKSTDHGLRNVFEL